MAAQFTLTNARPDRVLIVNSVRDQLLAGAGFSLNKYSGIGWRYSFNLFEHRYKRRTLAYDPLESALVRSLIAASESVVRSDLSSRIDSHKGPPGPFIRCLAPCVD